LSTYIFQDVEVKKTGRAAVKRGPFGGKDIILYEVTPIRDNDGTWTKFVPIESLFTVISETDLEQK
jgi:hypothetical protein